MPGLLEGRVALITGAGSGLARPLALAMAGAGARIVSVDINVGAAVRVAQGCRRRCRGSRLRRDRPAFL